MPKITFMGAGSTVFAKNVLGDSMLIQNKQRIFDELSAEEAKFETTLQTGLNEFNKVAGKLAEHNQTGISDGTRSGAAKGSKHGSEEGKTGAKENRTPEFREEQINDRSDAGTEQGGALAHPVPDDRGDSGPNGDPEGEGVCRTGIHTGGACGSVQILRHAQP